ncbi:related to Exonuclease V, mitochondrial [Saccharomycodes ludwigii]|uniref:Exonuclease V, mitochondrial n=2 Tax=Saccharomycodes ludwigii TaxID=36035 RepID=A0A376B452_9ASCO|nr:related to Exonuclease V, mitochondrial [Saccharomycodes ludwigii]
MDEYKLDKITKLGEIFKVTDDGYLNYQEGKTNDDLPNPFQQLGKSRLSVTNLLTKTWCELREYYDIYSNMPKFITKNIRLGKKGHSALESSAHKVFPELADVISEVQVPASKKSEIAKLVDDVDQFYNFASSWCTNIVRIVDLFKNGEAREILVHSYVDCKSSEFIKELPLHKNTVDGSQKEILISGIIDHLKLEGTLPLIGQFTKTLDTFIDMGIPKLLDKKQERLNDYKISVSDIKTRSRLSIPYQKNVINSSKLQVMYYRYFLENLSLNPEHTYYKLLLNAQKRNYDVDKPLHAVQIRHLLTYYGDFFYLDFLSLKRGEKIGFVPLDEFGGDYDGGKNIFINDYDFISPNLKQIYPLLFEGTWYKLPTLRYLAARMAQLYQVFQPNRLENKLRIEYYMGKYRFAEKLFEYDFGELNRHLHDSMGFWMGKRQVSPVKSTLKTFSIYCNGCDYSKVCLYKNKNVDGFKQLGNSLKKIYSDS